MQQWEYRVIHINVDAGPAPEPPDPKTASDHLQGVLSPTYLAREFPEHYGKESEAARRKLHPAEQLQSFLNLLGREGWEMTETSQVGPLLMFFFKRPLRPAPKLIAAASETAGRTATAASKTSPGEPTQDRGQGESSSHTDNGAADGSR